MFFHGQVASSEQKMLHFRVYSAWNILSIHQKGDQDVWNHDVLMSWTLKVLKSSLLLGFLDLLDPCVLHHKYREGV